MNLKIKWWNYNTLKDELMNNIIYGLNEFDYNNIYNKSVILINTRTYYCHKNMNGCNDYKLNEKWILELVIL